ncbi:MAG: sensor histidine kinase [Calditrichaeota bacterium]|nr:MAG: sensor histidine kinase [Calditrichota bacterium]MBL1204456.1 sensor histidine kinase [Calditrichota bacterium]NOG44285.1 HAMP domain-containing protein [Calditrichota bacterium]
MAIETIIADLMDLNPSVEIYLTDIDGNLAAHFANPDKIKLHQINTTPIKAFLSKTRHVPLPIMGDDPKTPDKKKVFSATEINLGPDKKGYLYIILGSELYDTVMSGVGGSYILSTTAIIFGVTLLFAGVLGSILFFNLTKRLRRMTDIVTEFEKGNYRKRIVVQSDDEVGQLTTAFNHMAETIEMNMDELKKNDRLRRELIANVSHDLRSPLTSIQGYIETILMREDKMDPEERTLFLETVLRNVTNLNSLVTELFELSKLDTKQNELTKESFSIAELVQDIVLKFQPQAEAKSVNLITKIPNSLEFVIGDISMIDRVISNLIDNAIRYIKNGGKVTLLLKNENGFVEINIIDNGDGIPENDLPHIFDRFYRVEKSRSKDSGGSGLGLAIVKKVVEAHKSKIIVESKVNEGTKFSFKLKKHKPDRIPA